MAAVESTVEVALEAVDVVGLARGTTFPLKVLPAPVNGGEETTPDAGLVAGSAGVAGEVGGG